MPTDPKDALAQAREDALRRHNEQQTTAHPQIVHNPQGLIPHLVAWKNAAVESTKRRFHWLVPATKPIRWIAPKIGHAFTWHWKMASTSKGEDGHRHFNPRRLAACLLAETVFLALSPFIAVGTYYHATLRNYDDVFVPNAGVFVNQQFVHPNEPGHIIAPRDEIFTVLGQHLDENGKVESIRFDVDSNMYFFYKSNAMRPDLQAAKMVPISPYGAMCNVQATGFYTRLPRFFRANAVKWLDMRPEIVSVNGDCVQLEQVPGQYHQGIAPPLSPHLQPLHAPQGKEAAPAPAAAPPGGNAGTSAPKALEAVPH